MLLLSSCTLCIEGASSLLTRNVMHSSPNTVPRFISRRNVSRAILTDIRPCPTRSESKTCFRFARNSSSFPRLKWSNYCAVRSHLELSKENKITSHSLRAQRKCELAFPGLLQKSHFNACDVNCGFRPPYQHQTRFYSIKPQETNPKDENRIVAPDERRDRIFTVPNVLTTLRMAMAPVLGYLVLVEAYPMACGVFVVAGLTDLLDGYIARNFHNQTSALGSFIDPLADKLLVSILFVTLTFVNLIPVLLTSLVVARDVCLASAGFYVRYITLDPRPKSLKEFFDITNPSAKLQPTLLSKVNTAVQLAVVALTLAAPVFEFVEHPALQALWYLTATTTICSGVGYIFAKDTFRLVQQRRKKT